MTTQTQETQQNIIEYNADRTDLPLVVIPDVFDDMVTPFQDAFDQLKDIARVRMYTEFTFDQQEFVNRAADADALIVIGMHLTNDMLDSLAKHVKVFAFGGTGAASYVDIDRAKELGVRICNVRHYGNAAVAEFTFALMLELTRHVGKLDQEVRAGNWDGMPATDLHGKTLAIVGLGGIGQTVATIANGFGMHVTAWNSGHGDPERFTKFNVTPVDDLATLMGTADIVSFHMPLTDETRGMITAQELDAIRPGTMVINTARAEIIEPGALVARLERGDLIAGLDVYATEPLPMDSPLRSLPNMILTPHVAWRTDGANRNLTHQCVEDIASYYTGGNLNVLV